MISPEQFATYLKLQQYVLSLEESEGLVEKLLEQIFNQLPLFPIDCQFMATVVVDTIAHVYRDYFLGLDKTTNKPIIQKNLLNFQPIFDKNGAIESDLLWGKTVIISNPSVILSVYYLKNQDIKTVIIRPLIMAKKLDGVYILGFSKEAQEIPQSDFDFIQLTNNLLTMAYRLQDTQLSYLKISEEVYKMNLQLHQLDKLKNDFVSIASHELRTPMTAIKSYLWMALKRADMPLSERMQKYLSRAYISTERLINLVNDMLNVSRIESGSIEINPKEFDIVSLVDESLQMFIPRANEKNIKTEIIKEKIPSVFADPDKVTRVFLNLLGNALKFTPDGGVITVSFFTDGKVVEISIKDNGVGISRDDLSRLFKKFGRLDNSYVAAATSGGTGLGLYISKSLVELMGGKIWARSEGEGKGTTFTFSLPVITPEVLANREAYIKKPAGEVKRLEPVEFSV